MQEVSARKISPKTEPFLESMIRITLICYYGYENAWKNAAEKIGFGGNNVGSSIIDLVVVTSNPQ